MPDKRARKRGDDTPEKASRGAREAPRLSAGALARHNGENEESAAAGSTARGASARDKASGPCCFHCGATPSATSKFPVGVTDACAFHWELYLSGFTTYGSWREFNAKKDKDTAIQEAWTSAEETKTSGEKHWLPTQVQQSKIYKCTVTKSMAGPSRAQLKDLLSVSPERIGVKMQDLVDVNNAQYKGLLIPNPARPFTEFNFTKTIGVERATVAMGSAGQVHEHHADVVFDFAKAEMQKEKDVKDAAVKMRTTPWDLTDLAKKSSEYRGVDVHPMNCSPMPAMLRGHLGNVDEDAARTFGPPARHEPPEDVANLADVADHEAGEGELDEGAAADAEEAGGIGKGSGGKRVPMEDGLPITDAARDDLVQRRINAYDIDKIMRNENMGRERRWCSDSRDLFLREGDVRANALSKHLDLAKHAENLVSSSTSEMGAGMLETAVKELQDGGVFIPNNMKFQLWRRYCDDKLGDALKSHDANTFIQAIVPWSGSEKTLDGNKPRIGLLDCSN
ncbi:unnamed protein product [Prorocentrum cordatum]|uniref:Uncharacterized protein n=1 Tax=Prorocentrum cordatum TaxID=2364126 RepID=A0ABN9XUU6_9DINO|nr:unnamed protein product [Polarella glacialis]